jgi:outer membrane protein assembly factor BamD (BamD/ComL family)
MRNGQTSFHRRLVASMIAMWLIVGCAPRKSRQAALTSPPAQQAILDAGFAALESKQYNEAIAKADEFLGGSPHGAGSPEALYLKGRALEGKNATGEASADEVKQNLEAARAAYMQALDRTPRQPLESYIRTSLANVAYFQDDYATAVGQWKAAYDKLDRDDIKAWALYRVGVSQQRLGQFAQADQTFANVQAAHPDTVPAQRAKEHQGARAFFVQVATFANPQGAQTAVAELSKKGIVAAATRNQSGNTVVRIGPVSSYAQAQYWKTQLASQYPDAIVLP